MPIAANEKMAGVTSLGGARPTADDGGRIPFSLRVAVTGHRVLADPAAVTRAVDEAIDLIVRRLPGAARGTCPLVAVSALADGADRVVARSVLRRPGGRLEVILPMPAAEYIKDFEPAGSGPEFERLLAAACSVITLPAQPTREDGYAAAGRAVVDRADITIAIWDGQHAAGKGGTGQIVRYARRQRRPLVWLPAAGGDPVVENLGEIAGLGPGDLDGLDEFNAAPVRPEESRACLRPFTERTRARADGVAAAPGGLNPLLDWIGPPLGRAEVLARRFQALYIRLSAALFALAALAVCVVAAQLIFFPEIRLIVAGEVTCLLTIMSILEWGRRRHVQQRWISTRYLAERLRNAFFIALSGAEERPSASLLTRDDPAAPWAQAAFRQMWARRPSWDAQQVALGPLRDFLADAWIEGQREYFDQAAKLAFARHRISGRVVEGLFGVSVVVALIHVTLGGPENWFHHLLSLLSIGIPACAAALAGYTAQREYLHHARRYARMAEFLAEARDQMLAGANRARVRTIAATVDRLLREERGDWFGTVGQHDLELPA